MKRKQKHLRNASFLALIFMILGYVIKFYPEQVRPVDEWIQTGLRGQLPDAATRFWTTMTLFGNVPSMIGLTLVFAAIFYAKNWKAEAYFVAGGMVAFVLISTGFKYLYMRPRPALD